MPSSNCSISISPPLALLKSNRLPSYFFLAGQKRYLMPCNIRIHLLSYSGLEGWHCLVFYQEYYGMMTCRDERYFKILAQALNKPIDLIKDKYTQTKNFSSQEALDFGFATEIVDQLPVFK